MEAGKITFPHKKHATCIFTHQAFFAEIGQIYVYLKIAFNKLKMHLLKYLMFKRYIQP